MGSIDVNSPRSLWISDDATMAFVVSNSSISKLGFNPSLPVNASGAWWFDGQYTLEIDDGGSVVCSAFDMKVVVPGNDATTSSISVSSIQLWISCASGQIMLVTFANPSSSSFVGTGGFIALVVIVPFFIVLVAGVWGIRAWRSRKCDRNSQRLLQSTST